MMAFFSITRYQPDEGKDKHNEDKSKDILRKLHEAAERKRKAQDTEQTDRVDHVDEVEAAEVTTPVKKRKKTNDVVECTSPKKKTKEKKQPKTETEAESPEKNDESHNSDSKLAADGSDKKRRHRKNKDNDTVVDDDTPVIDNEDGSVVDIDKDATKARETDKEEIGGFTVMGDDVRFQTVAKVHRVLPDWLSHPSVIVNDIRRNRTPLDQIKGLASHLVDKLKKNGINDLFPVQRQLLSVLLKEDESGYMYGDAGYRSSDICCSAPTGSGKTLAYVLPIIQALSGCRVRQIRALIVVPVRDLVKQVYNVFKTYCKDTDVKVGQTMGAKTFSVEQNELVQKRPRGYHSLVDILVSTPGRLIDHIDATPGFSLQHLQFLVIDEADRMMDEIRLDWLTCVENAVFSSTLSNESADRNRTSEPKIFGSIQRHAPGPLTANNVSVPSIRFQKLLFSATLSQNPEKLQQLNLFQPKLFTSVVEDSQKRHTGISANETSQGEFVGKYTTPAGLTEFFVECKLAERPLVMMHFINDLQYKNILCFTNSVEATHRLYSLIKLTCKCQAREFSSAQTDFMRNHILKQFTNGKINVLICSDAMARGMDIKGVDYVISYESPKYLKTYIHRVGRTARADKEGTAITLLDRPEIFLFKKMLSEGGKTELQKMKLTRGALTPHVESYKASLKQLSSQLEFEETNKTRLAPK